MHVCFASEPAPGRPNEDFVVAGPDWAVVLDGATAPPGVDSGCVHNPAWLAHRLGGALATRLSAEDERPLDDLLAESIKTVCEMHADRCDLSNPDSPSATVAMLRLREDVLEWLVLADSPVLLDVDGEVRVIRDDRVDHLPGYTLEAVRTARNAPDGFWVASTRPAAAYEALSGRIEASSVRRAAMFSDGASRLVERFETLDWTGLLDLTDREGPLAVIERTRAAESAEPDGARRGKRYDDATAALFRL
ncbi:protein phosphatase 2C domain-containing protein [Actinomadura gamaensis]|uniref:Protein phosphatase 2C domain-containing protein n=1 Tax=Actinomadura gamaensis TaxID=1763541 RepID=A0ABV9UFE1_9ACTN